MKKTVFLSFVALATTVFAGTNTFKVDVLQDSMIEGKTLKAGQYKLSMENGNAVFKAGKESIAVPAKEETQTDKVSSTQMVYTDGRLQEIRVGGTHTKITFQASEPMHSGS